MFANQNVGERGGSRPFVVALILLLLFLSTTQDWGSPATHTTRTQLKGGQPQDITTETKETIIRNLVKSNEELEKENSKLRLEVFNLRAAAKTQLTMENTTDSTSTDGPPALTESEEDVEVETLVIEQERRSTDGESNDNPFEGGVTRL